MLSEVFNVKEGSEVHDADVLAVFLRFDTDASGSITIAEFLEAGLEGGNLL
jgi:hypothetical protein